MISTRWSKILLLYLPLKIIPEHSRHVKKDWGMVTIKAIPLAFASMYRFMKFTLFGLVYWFIKTNYVPMAPANCLTIIYLIMASSLFMMPYNFVDPCTEMLPDTITELISLSDHSTPYNSYWNVHSFVCTLKALYYLNSWNTHIRWINL